MCETSLVNGAMSNSDSYTDSTHCGYANTSESAECEADSTFELRSTFASCDEGCHDDVSLMTMMGDKPASVRFDKKSSMTAQQGKSKRRAQKRTGGDNGSPLRRGRKERKPKSEKKLSLGWRKGSRKSNKSQAIVTLADLAQSVPQISIESRRTVSSMESPVIGNGSLTRVEWVRHGSMELELANTTPESQKSCIQEEESSLSECE